MKKLLLLLLALALGLGAAAETLIIPESVRVIGEEAFLGVTAPERLVISEGVERVEARAFAETAFEEIELPASLSFIADDAFAGAICPVVSAPEGSYALEWATRMGCAEKSPFFASAGKDMDSFSAAFQIVENACQTEWEGAGKIRYVEQFGGARTYVPEYWVSASDARGSCTRAAGSMAAAYMGINALPRDAKDFTKFQSLMKSLGCPAQTDRSCSLSTFILWYDEYARDVSGDVSPVVIYTEHATSKHAFVVIGRDAESPDTFYVADSGTSSCVGRVRLAEANGRLTVARYELSTGKTDERYGSAHPMIYIWRYKRS